jgi:hypothetical protein
MADWTKETLATRALEYLGVVGEGQSPTGEQQKRAEEAVDSVYPQLRKRSLVPFAVSAIDEWGQLPLVKIVAAEVGPRFGFPLNPGLRADGIKDLEGGIAAHRLPVTVSWDYF